jgi:hypothetical protein
MQVDVKLDREMARLVERESTLANRAAGFALLAALLAIVALVAMPVTSRETDRTELRALAAAPLAGAAGAAARAYAARRGLEAVRSRKVDLLSETEPVPDGGAEPPEAA